jgi:hypothetical protein
MGLAEFEQLLSECPKQREHKESKDYAFLQHNLLKLLKINGGRAWESNPPGTVLAPHTGFEVREPHQ